MSQFSKANLLYLNILGISALLLVNCGSYSVEPMPGFETLDPSAAKELEFWVPDTDDTQKDTASGDTARVLRPITTRPYSIGLYKHPDMPRTLVFVIAISGAGSIDISLVKRIDQLAQPLGTDIIPYSEEVQAVRITDISLVLTEGKHLYFYTIPDGFGAGIYGTSIAFKQNRGVTAIMRGYFSLDASFIK